MEVGKRVSRAKGDAHFGEIFSGVHLGIGLVTVGPGERAVLPADLSGREEVWYVLSGQGVYQSAREGGGEGVVGADVRAETDGEAVGKGPARTQGEGTGARDEQRLSEGKLAVTRGGEGAEVACEGPRPLVLLAIRSPLPARGPKVVEAETAGKGTRTSRAR